MSLEISHGHRTARKQHRCFHCRRNIAVGESYYYQTVVYDVIETLKMHTDCEAFAWAYIKISGYTYYDFIDGYPPTYDLIVENLSPPELDGLFNSYRGYYPHVITRMEHNIQDQEIRYNNWVAGGRK